jgi:hypothetical protein
MSLIVRAAYCCTMHEGECIAHRIEVRDDGSVHVLDHPDLEMLIAFSAFGAKKPECLSLYEELSIPEPVTLLDLLSYNDRCDVMAKIALRWARHVEPLVVKYTDLKFPSRMLDVAQRALDRGEWPETEGYLRERFEDTRDDLRARLREDRYSPPLNAARDAVHVIEAAVTFVRDVLGEEHGPSACLQNIKAMGRSAYYAKGDEAVAEGGDYRDEDQAKHDEVAWQRLAVIKAASGLELNAIAF